MTGARQPRNAQKFWAADRLFDAVQDRPHGAMLTYVELSAIIGADAQGHYGRGIVLRVRDRLLRQRQKLMLNVREQGYRIAAPEEHVGASQALQSAGRRRLRRGLGVVVHVNTTEMSDGARDTLYREQVRVRLKLAVDQRLTAVKRLPSAREVEHIISARQLVRALTRRRATDTV